MQLSRLARSLSELCTLVPTASGSAQDPQLRRACFDSRAIQPGDLYCALRGARVDGRDFVESALQQGAAAVLSIGCTQELPVPELRVQLGVDPALAAGMAAAELAGRPSDELFVAAITGTNGKSTVVHLLQQAWGQLGVPAARVGTLGFAFGGQERPALNTTPAADELHAFLSEAVAGGARAVAVEASSHGIAQHRLAGLTVDLAAWTNLSHDHLDYHGDMEHYATAKAQLIHELPAGAPALLPADPRIAAAVRGARAECLSWALDRDDLPLTARCVAAEAGGLVLEVGGRLGGGRLQSRLVGRHNAENLLLAFGVLRLAGIDADSALGALAQAGAAPGRLQRVASDSPWRLFVDYAHTPDAIEHALAALRGAFPQARLGIVVGAGGDRDPAKRAPMGAAAARGSDWCVLTSDNPRTEDPQAILDQVLAGARGVRRESVEAVVDRREAMRLAVGRMRPQDVLLVAGKGHEPYQEIDGVRYDFDDRLILEEIARCLA